MTATDRLREGQMFGRYQIVRLIGEGGMGAVFEVVHPALRKRFAIKTLLPAIAEKEEVRARFLREGEAASSINHPNVVSVTDVGTEGGIPYLVMELLEGQTLAELLFAQGALEVERALAVLLPVISAVATGHDRGVIHRDLKPQNIFLAKGPWGDQIPKVLDFGVSKLTGDDNAVITNTFSILGTAAYMSPEQARGAKRVTFHSDQYSLGLILYEMLTGVRAHPGENSLEILHNVASGAIRPLRQVKPELRGAIDAPLGRMLAPLPSDRYPSLLDCGRALLPLADDKTRMALANAFNPSVTRPPAAAATNPGLGGPVPMASSPASDLPSGSGGVGVGRTLALPDPGVASGRSDTTLRHAATETGHTKGAAPRTAAAKIGVGLAAAIGLSIIAGGIGWMTRTPDSGVPPSPLSSPPPSAPPVAVGAAEAPAPPRAVPAPVPFEVRTSPPEAEITLDDGHPVRGHLELALPLTGSSHQLRVSAPGYSPRTISFGPEDRPPSEIRLERTPAAARPRAVDRSAASAGASRPSPARAARGSEPSKAGEVTPAPKRGSNNALILQ